MSKPLWRILYRAYDQSKIPPDAQEPHVEDECSLIDRYGYAAEIEAIADWLVPETAAVPISEIVEAQQFIRSRIRARLLEQARIAREGE